MSLYEDLGVAPDADEAVIAAAHRRAAKRHHPDANGDREQFERISRAALVLRDPIKRKRYDETGEVDDRANNDHAITAELLTKAFDAALERCQGDIDHTDIIAGMQRWFDGEITRISREKAQAQSARDRMSKALRKLRFKGKGADILTAVLNDRLKMVVQAISQFEKQADHLCVAKARAAEYSWDVAPRWEQAVMSAGLAGWGSSTSTS